MLLVRFGDLVLSRGVEWYNWSGWGLDRRHMGRIVGAERLTIGIGCDKSQMSLIVVFIGACNAGIIGVECGLQGLDQGPCMMLSWLVYS